ncbi:PilZ domain-containing protein [candidate division FCPU426 bacterium]|nr:PilZ domain-containing protein [candidate division FCPU426 bacterium]
MKDEKGKGDTFAERRRHPRLPLKMLVHYLPLEKTSAEMRQESQTLNIGIGGIAMRSDRELAVNEYIVVDLFIPPENKRDTMNFMAVCPEAECHSITVQSRVAWCSPFVEKKYIIGVEFIDMAAADLHYLQAFLQEYKIPDPIAGPL